jgi:hypothetical protein
MNIKKSDYKLYFFRDISINELRDILAKDNDLQYTGFKYQNGNTYNSIYKSGNAFYTIDESKSKIVEKMILDSKNSNGNKFRMNCDILGQSILSLQDLMTLYKHYNDNLKVDNYFYVNNQSHMKCNEVDFLTLVIEVFKLESEIKRRNLDSYETIKYIFDKYKTEADYWNPIANYGTIDAAIIRVEEDNNRVVKFPHSFMGLINEKYATCEGIADGLAELYRYFGIDAETVQNRIHGVVKVHVIDDDGSNKVSYIDLAKEISPAFADTKYSYTGDRPTLIRKNPSRVTHDYFMNKRGNTVGDSDGNIAVDYKPNLKLIHRDKPTIRIVNSTNTNEESTIVMHGRRK